MNLKGKIHASLQEKALNNAIKQLIPDIGDFFVDDKKLLFQVINEKLEQHEKLNFNLPSWNEVVAIAKTIYKNFDDTQVTKIVYTFNYLTVEKDLIVDAKNSDVILGFNNFTDVIIKGANNIKLYSEALKKGGLSVNARNIEVVNMTTAISKNLELTSEFILFSGANLVCIKNINIDSKFVEFYRSNITTMDTMNIKTDLILSEKANLKALNKIEITDINCDKIEGVYAPMVIYNGQDISYSKGIVMPKLRSNLIEVLRKVRDKVRVDIKDELEIETENLKQELNNKPIVKMLKK